MSGRLALLAAVVFAGVALAAEPRFDNLILSDAKNGAPKSEFKPDTPKIFLSAKLHDVKSSIKVKCAWIAEKTAVAPADYQIDATELTARRGANGATFALSRPNTGWPAGTYRVELSIGGKPAGMQRFSIKP